MAYTKTVWNDRIKDSQGNIVQEGTPVSAGNLNKIEQGIADAHKQMEQTAKETTSLPYGLSVVNSPNGSPLDVQIEGRTLVSMGNSDLEGGKKYVLADPKTAVVIDGTTYKGISKFEGKNSRPAIIRTANFEGKVSGSTVENPHVSKAGFKNTLLTPVSVWQNQDIETTGYTLIYTLDGKSRFVADSTSGSIAQMLFSFNIIEEIERKVGKIPGSTIADKVAWLKNNLNKLTCNWHGNGSSVGGNKANLVRWDAVAGIWTTPSLSHTSANISKLTLTPTISTAIDTNGFIHFLAYAEASDGIIASTIITDYVELDIELKSNADFYAPRVSLYEVPQESYDKILVEWDAAAVATRYPMVEGMKSLQNPIVTIEGENLLPSFAEWSVHVNAKVISSYELELNAPSANQPNTLVTNCLPLTQYTFNVESNGFYIIDCLDNAGNLINTPAFLKSGSLSTTFTTPANAQKISIKLTNGNTTGIYSFKNPMLSLGSAVKPFKLRNPSYLYIENILRALTGSNDVFHQDDGRWKVLKKCEEVILDSNWFSSHNGDYLGFKRVSFNLPSKPFTPSGSLIKGNGSLMKYVTDIVRDSYSVSSTYDQAYLSVPDTETGFGEPFVPNNDEWKAYFNGWKVKTADANGKPIAWVSVLDGKDAPTQTLDYVKVNKAPDYTGYRLLYQLATPRVVDVTDKVEGALNVSGQTQLSLDSGGIIREKIKPSVVTNLAYINRKAGDSNDNPLSNRVLKIINIYKGTNSDLGNWSMEGGANGLAYGAQRAVIPTNLYDSAADYFVTYLVQEKEKFTTNPVNVKASYNTSIRSTVDQMNEQLSDVKSLASIHDRYLYKLLLAAKANGWSV